VRTRSSLVCIHRGHRLLNRAPPKRRVCGRVSSRQREHVCVQVHASTPRRVIWVWVLKPVLVVVLVVMVVRVVMVMLGYRRGWLQSDVPVVVTKSLPIIVHAIAIGTRSAVRSSRANRRHGRRTDR
jgi:hypothetical protein